MNVLFRLADGDSLVKQRSENVIQLLYVVFSFGHDMQHFIVADKALFATDLQQMRQGLLRAESLHRRLRCALFRRGPIQRLTALFSLVFRGWAFKVSSRPAYVDRCVALQAFSIPSRFINLAAS